MASPIAKYINKFWFDVFKDQEFINALVKSLDEVQTVLEADLDDISEAVSRQQIHPLRTMKWIYATYTEQDLNSDVMLFNDGVAVFDGAYSFGERRHSQLFSLPIGQDVKEIPFILSDLFNPSVILQDKIDYYIDVEKSYIFFRVNPFLKDFNKKFIDVEGSSEPILGISMWFYNSKQDFKDLQYIYGDTAKISLKSNEYFKKIMNTIWDLRLEGGTICNINRLLANVTDSDVAEEDGTVTRLFEEGGRNWVEIGGRVYSGPSGSTCKFNVGDSVKACDMLFDTVSVFTYLDAITSDEIPAVHLGEGLIGKSFPGGVMIENKAYDFPEKETVVVGTDPNGRVLVEPAEDGSYNYLVEKIDGYDIYLLVNDSSWSYQLAEAYMALPFKGRPDTVANFIAKLTLQSIATGYSITDLAKQRASDMHPPTINLFEEYQKNIFAANVFYIRIDSDYIPEGVDPGMFLSYIKNVIPAYSMALTYMEAGANVTYTSSSITDSAEAFMVADISESTAAQLDYSDRVERNISI